MKTKKILTLISIICYFGFLSSCNSKSDSAYGGKVRTIPGVIQAEDFNTGGEGVGFHDTSPENEGFGYRINEGVDIKGMDTIKNQSGFKPWMISTESTPTVGWIYAEEWMKYSVNVRKGTYDISLKYATPGLEKKLAVFLDDILITTFDIPNTKDYFSYNTITNKNIKIDVAGKNKILKLMSMVQSAEELDFDFVEFIPSK
jgi:hypothetical protein